MMMQEEINRAEWENLANWSHPVFGVYFSKRDSRIWVPKRTPSWGWTLNLGHPSGMWWLVGLILLPAGLLQLFKGRRR